MTKNLLKLLIAVLIVSMASEAFSQTYRLKAGLNLSTMVFKDDQGNATTPSKLVPGFNLGVTAEFPLNDLFSFETGLLLTSKGFKMKVIADETLMLTPLYLEIPFNAKATFNLSGAKIYGTFGPYLGYGIGGKSKYTTSSETHSTNIAWGSGANDDLKTLDFGLSIGGGVEINAFQLGLSYGIGLADIMPDNQVGTKIKNKVIGITIGYKFGRK